MVNRPCRRLPHRWLWCCGSRDPKVGEHRKRSRACAGEPPSAELQPQLDRNILKLGDMPFRCSRAPALTHQRRSGGKTLPEFPQPFGPRSVPAFPALRRRVRCPSASRQSRSRPKFPSYRVFNSNKLKAERKPGVVNRPCRRLLHRWLWCCGSRDPKAAEDRNRRRACAGEPPSAELRPQ